jgi:hexosaminidase
VGVVAATAHGLWNATRTALQLVHADGSAPAVHIVDTPRFEWRGAMLDVARHPFSVNEVCRFIDLIADAKLNHLHLHLSDDQGWRLEMPDWPALTEIGGSTATGGDPGGWFTLADWGHIVAHAATRFVTVVPEIDMPGHTNAALASVAALNPGEVAPPLYTGKEVGFSSLRLDLPLTRRFVSDIVATLAALTPGDHLHIGGDEAHSTDAADYVEFITFLQQEVERHGKSMIGWEEITAAPLHRHTLVQHWLRPATAGAAPDACRFIMSPARHTYLDMQHAEGDPLGRRWAGAIDLPTIHDWDPAEQIPNVDDRRIAGVEAPLWTEKVRTFHDVQTLCFPRLLCLAEVGWTPQAQRSWEGFAPRLAAATDRLAADGVPVYRSASLGSEG